MKLGLLYCHVIRHAAGITKVGRIVENGKMPVGGATGVQYGGISGGGGSLLGIPFPGWSPGTRIKRYQRPI
ncbi:MAG TPA: hypothetical protein PLR25_28055, partial [Planctomycetaceae bacterium]|nr:hypothetical protein [Planctomycetaceae bacterium]